MESHRQPQERAGDHSGSWELDDPEVAGLLAKYQADLDAGIRPDRESLLSHFPDIRQELADCLDGLEFVVRASQEAHLPLRIGEHAEVLHDGGRLGDYELVREIGRGGMGVVYEATEESLDRRVAVKVLAFASFLDKRQIRRFKVEATAAASLKHPNIVSVYSVGYDRGVHFYAMELVDGPSVAEVIRDLREAQDSRIESASATGSRVSKPGEPAGPESPWRQAGTPSGRAEQREHFRRVAQLVADAADALGHAHHMGVIHRDIKPSNLLLDQDGTVMVTDFGLARSVASGSLTRTGDRVGTPRYMSPEQLDDSRAVSHLTDIYSLGLTLYELLTLEPAFPQSSVNPIASRLVAGDVPAPTRVDARIPRDLETIVLKATAAEPSMRYASAYELRDDLRRFLEDRPVQARRATQFELLRRFCRRNRAMASLVSVVLLLLALIAVGSTLVAQHFAARSKAQERQIYARDIQAAMTAVENGSYRKAELVLRDWAEQDATGSLRNFEWFYLWKRAHPGVRRRTMHFGWPVFSAVYGDGGKTLAVSSLSNTTTVFDAHSGESLHALEGPVSDVYCLANQPKTGLLIAADKGGFITLWDPASGAQRDQLQIPVASDRNKIHNLAASPDGRLIAVDAGFPGTAATVHRSATVHVVDMRTGDWEQLDGFRGRVCMAFMDEGRTLITASHDGLVRFWDTRSWAIVRTEKVSFGGVSTISVSPQEDVLALGIVREHAAGTDARVEIRDIQTWAESFTDHCQDDFVNQVAFSHSGELLAVALRERRLQLVERATQRVRVVPHAHSNVVVGVTFSPHDEYVVTCSGDGLARVWEVAGLLARAPADTYFRGHTQVVTGGVFLDGSRVACTVDAGGQGLVWDAHTGEVMRRFQVDMQGGWHSGIRISPDKRWVAMRTGGGKTTTVHLYRCGRTKGPPALTHVRSLRLPHPSMGGGHNGGFSTDSKSLAVLCKRHVVLVDVASGRTRQLGPFPRPVVACDFSPAGELVLGTDGILLYDADRLTRVAEMEPPKEFTTGVAFSRDGKTLFSGGSDGLLRIRDAASRQLIRECGPRFDYFTHLQLSPDGHRVYGVGMDGNIRIWDVGSGEALLDLPMWKTSYPGRIEVSDDGRSLLAANGRLVVVFRGAAAGGGGGLRIESLDHLGGPP